MSTTKFFAAAFLVSASVTFAPAFADEGTVPGTQVAAVDAQLPVAATADVAPVATARDDAARTGSVLSAEEVRARLHGVAPAAATPGARDSGEDATLIREVAGMYTFQHYGRVGTPETDVAEAEAFETAAYVADAAQE